MIIAVRGVVSGLTARIALNAEKGRAKLDKLSKFWDQRPWSHILLTGSDFINVKNVELNFKGRMDLIISCLLIGLTLVDSDTDLQHRFLQ